MQLSTINSKLTKSPNEVACNLDKEPTEFEIKKITTPKFYGSITFKFQPGCVILTSDPDDRGLNAVNITDINERFISVQREEEQMQRTHDDMVKSVAERTELPID